MANKTITQNLVPIIVGIVSLMFLDNSLGNLQAINVKELFKHPLPRAIALFGAAYGANGGRIYQALFAFSIYALLENYKDVMQAMGIDIFKVPFNIVESDSNTTPTPTPTVSPTQPPTSTVPPSPPPPSPPPPSSPLPPPTQTPAPTSQNIAATRSYAEIPITSTFLRPASSRSN